MKKLIKILSMVLIMAGLLMMPWENFTVWNALGLSLYGAGIVLMVYLDALEIKKKEKIKIIYGKHFVNNQEFKS